MYEGGNTDKRKHPKKHACVYVQNRGETESASLHGQPNRTDMTTQNIPEKGTRKKTAVPKKGIIHQPSSSFPWKQKRMRQRNVLHV
jgi:hypothetical protein